MPTAGGPTVNGTRASTHQILGVGLAAVTAAALDAGTTSAAVLVAGAWAGSLLPDADRAGTRVHRPTRLERRVWPARVLGWIARLPLRALVVLKHRGFTHSLVAAAVAATICGLLASLVAPELATTVGGGVAIGYLAHVAADACTPAGVALLAPLSNRRRWLMPSPARIPTGSVRERVLAVAIAAAAVATTALLAG
jgi:inner membrane protein